MSTRATLSFSLLAAICATAGCLSNRVEDAPPDVFACDDALDCEEGQTCLLGRCDDEPPPRVMIRAPEAFEALAPQPDDPAGRISVTVGVGGENLVLVEPSTDGYDTSEGFIELVVDGTPLAELTSGDLFAGASTTVEIENTPGPHRITAIARRADGTRYDNPDATSSQIVWVDDYRPHVAIVQPRPGSKFSVEGVAIDVEIATLNFTLVPPMESADAEHGHAHIHYDDYFPHCPADPMCDCCYIEVAAPQAATQRLKLTTTLPPAGAGSATLTAVLRETTHPPFVYDGRYIFDTVEIERSADIPAPPRDE